MQEKVLGKRKNGMAFLLLFSVLYLAAIGGVVLASFMIEKNVWSAVLLFCSILWLAIGWAPFLGLKVLKPQEALVLTPVWKICGDVERRWFLFCQSVLYRGKSGRQNQAQSKRRCGWRQQAACAQRRSGRTEYGDGQQ